MLTWEGKPIPWVICGFPMGGDEGICKRPKGHTSWSIETGWRTDPVTGVYGPVTDHPNEVSAYAHMSRPAYYDADVWPYMELARG